MTHYEEHVRDSALDNSRWDGFDRGDAHHDDRDQGSRVIGRMTNGGGHRVVIHELWFDGNVAYEVHVDDARVYSDYYEGNRARAITAARWWMAGCPV